MADQSEGVPGIQEAHPAGVGGLTDSCDGINACLGRLCLQRTGSAGSSQDVQNRSLNACRMAQTWRAHYQNRLQHFEEVGCAQCLSDEKCFRQVLLEQINQ